MKNLSHGTPCAVKAACTVWTGAKGSKESDLSVFLFRYEYSANFFYKLWKRIRKYNGLVTGLTQNVDELLRSDTARLMLANSEFLVMLNQSATDRAELAKLLNISDNQLGYVTNVPAGCGLIRCAGNIVPYSTILQPFRQDMQCGCCDERLYWHPKTNQWFCRKCGMWAKPLQAEEISATIAEKLCWLRQNPEIIHNPEGQANVQSIEVTLLNREIWQALTNAEPDVDALVAKILHRAELEYKFCTAGDADPATLLIQKACTEYVPTEGFPETFYKEVVSKVILYRDNHLELKLQNGQIV